VPQPRLVVPALAVFVAGASAAYAGRANDVRAEAFRLLNSGVAAYEKHDYKAAIEALEKSSNEALNSFRAYYFLGLAYAGDRRYPDAVESLKIALDLDPVHLQANVALGDAWLMEGNLDDASPSYYRALKLRAEYPAALDGLARLAEAEADDDQAIAFYDRAIASDKGFAPAYVHLGDLYLRQGKLDDAVKLLVEAVSVRPDFAEGLDRLAVAYGRLGFSNEAVATIRKAIALEPKSPDHQATLGAVLLGMGAVMTAKDAFQTALSLDPGQPEAHSGLAEIARRGGDFAGAAAQLDLALADPRTDRRTREALTKRRAALVLEGERSRALAALVDGGTATPADRREFAALLAARGDWDKAADLYAAVAQDDAAGRELLAFYLFRAGRFKAAHEAYAALARAGGRADLEVNDGAALARIGDDERAKEAFERALTIDPSQKTARLYLANALLRLGRSDDAQAAYKSFLAAFPNGEAAEQVRRILAALQPGAARPAAAAAPSPASPGVPR
jgi:tetratricopeptide (TPR) repeat protein